MKYLQYALYVALLCAGLLFAGWNWLASLKGEGAKEIILLVERSDNFNRIAASLDKEGLIHSERSFRWYVRLRGVSRSLKLGEYQVRSTMTLEEVVNTLISGKSILYRLVVPEGHNKFQIASQVEEKKLGSRKRFLELVESSDFIRQMHLPNLEDGFLPSSLEGYLYPDTYMLSKAMKEEDIIQQMVKRFKNVYRSLASDFSNSVSVKRNNLKPRDVITLASMVEKETGAGFERPLIASVFYNRLQKRMRLESDPTTIYGMWDKDGFFKGNIRRKNLRESTPYNTYTVPRLPKGPIANPGRNAILAVLYPAKNDYLFFVSKNDGTHVFTKNYREHKKAVNRLQRRPRMRRGKSWRNLPKKLRAKN